MMRRLLLDLLWSQLSSLGAFDEPGRTPEQARAAAGVTAAHGAWFAESLRILGAEGHPGRPDRPRSELWSEWHAAAPAWRENPDLDATHVLLGTVLPALPDVLTGRRSAVDVVTPDLTEAAHGTHPTTAFFRRVLADELAAHVQRLGDEPRILEIDAPTHPVLDIERPFDDQGFGGHDVVVAVDVLHTAPDVRRALRNVKATLGRGGVLLLAEATGHSLVRHLTTGLLASRHDDPELRIPGCPLLTAATWERVLHEEGFGPVRFPGRAAEDLGRQVVVAVSDGVIRQPRTAPRAEVAPRAAVPAAAPPAPAPAPAPRGVSGDQVRAHVVEVVVGALAAALQIDRSRIAAHEPFSGYGLDSIFAVKVARAVGRELGVELEITALFEYGTLAELTDFLVEEFGDEIGVPAAEPDAPVEPAPVLDEGGNEGGDEGMAIVGMSARFPGAEDVDEFWRIVEDGRRCVTTPPTGRADWAFHADDPLTPTLWGGFLDGVHEFDPLFFRMSVTEARQVSPELRLMLMTAWNAIEDAGHRPSELRTRPTGVFVAAAPSEYRADDGGADLMSLPSPSMIPNRISHELDLRGPSEQIDTTCSSSFVALHRAVRSIRDGECEQALVGAVNLVLTPAGFAGVRAAGMLTATGDVRPFQQDADGTARGEGVAAILIKPLRRAMEDGDVVHGVVRGTGVAHGGRGVSVTAPNIRGMKSAIASAYAAAGIDPRTVSYVESHAMSTLLADSAEIAALGGALRGEPSHDEDDAVYVGSVKPCIGHAEVCSGLAALVKTVQAMRHGTIPALPGFGRLHRDISLDGTRLRIAATPRPWPVRTGADGRVLPRRAGMNSFGIGGVNAHVVLEGRDTAAAVGEGAAGPQVLVLSAATEAGLRERARRMIGRLTGAGAPVWADVAYTSQVGREAMEHRLALVADTRDEAARVLAGWLDDEPDARIRVGVARRDPAPDDAAPDDAAPDRLDLLADRWVAGGSVDWDLLHEGTRRRRVSLPGYPFARRTCFAMRAPDRDPAAPVPSSTTAGETAAEAFVVDVVAAALGFERHEIDRTRSLADHGFHSLLLVAVLGRVRGAWPAFQPEWLRPQDTLDDLIARLATMGTPGAPTGPRYPELVHLNAATGGRPVFWVHGGLAGVESFRAIADRVDRPFYGIQARGFLTDDEPVEGIAAMAEYYLEIVRSVQPEGPYDVGGFCLGGVVAYEMTRLLQLRGQPVRSLVMVDSPDDTGLAKSGALGLAQAESAALQIVNSLLWPPGRHDIAELGDRLIHQDEVAGLGAAEFVRRLADLAGERGLPMQREQLVRFVRRNMAVQLAYGIAEHRIEPLPEPAAVDCTYFRNVRGLYLGELEPYFQVVGETFSLDHVNYWQDWERELPGWHLVDVDTANHMTLFLEEASLRVIEERCVEVYGAATTDGG